MSIIVDYWLYSILPKKVHKLASALSSKILEINIKK